MFKAIPATSKLSMGLILLSAGSGAMAHATEAPTATLKGVYEVVEFRSCVHTTSAVPVGTEAFSDDAALRNRVAMREQTQVRHATVTFNGDGTGTETNKNMTIRNNANADGQQAVQLRSGECNLTYTVNSDRSFTKTTACTNDKLAGYGSQQTTSTGTVGGQLAKGGQSFVLVNVEPTVITSINTQNDDRFQSICHLIGYGVKKRGAEPEPEEPASASPVPFRLSR